MKLYKNISSNIYHLEKKTLWGWGGHGFEIWILVLGSGCFGDSDFGRTVERRVKMAVGSLRESRRRARAHLDAIAIRFSVCSDLLLRRCKKDKFFFIDLLQSAFIFIFFAVAANFFFTCSSFFFIEIFGMVVATKLISKS
jgi:hypothetical protein